MSQSTVASGFQVGDRVILLDAPPDVQRRDEKAPGQVGRHLFRGPRGKITADFGDRFIVHLDQPLYEANNYNWIDNDYGILPVDLAPEEPLIEEDPT